jgi:pimeloyl-ACP methyl ester carboxylesterase
VIAGWTSPSGEEYAFAVDRGRQRRLLILPAWFDEGNKLRRLTVEVMRRLDGAGIDALLPDLPGCNESTAPLESQTVTSWRDAAEAAAGGFEATHVLAIRAGALVAPDLPGWRYAPIHGSQVLRAMLRARTIAAREAGRDETRDGLLEIGRREGLNLAGYRLGAAMITELETAEPPDTERQSKIAHADVGGAALWLRAEPDHDAAQADALAAIVSMGLLA